MEDNRKKNKGKYLAARKLQTFLAMPVGDKGSCFVLLRQPRMFLLVCCCRCHNSIHMLNSMCCFWAHTTPPVWKVAEC